MSTLLKLSAKPSLTGQKKRNTTDFITTTNRNAKQISSRFLNSITLLLLMFLVASPSFSQNTKTRKIDKNELELRKSKGKIIKGNVADSNGGLPGVNITLKGTARGSNTDFDGNFQFPLHLLVGDILVFEFIGLETQEVKIDSKTQFLKIKMKDATEILELIVLDEPQTKKLFKSKKSSFKKKKKKEE